MEGDNDDPFQDKTADFNFKLILIGDSQVGKTSLISRYIHDDFDENEKRSRVVKIQHKLFTIPNTVPARMAELHVWDTLGQEKFEAIAGIFFKGTAGAFLVFDLTRRETFEKMDRWYSKVEENCEQQIVVMLVGNKCDLPTRAVSYEEASEYAKSKKFSYLEVSAKTGANVKNAFTQVVTEIYRTISQSTGGVQESNR